ncbi:MAG: hypothetical protein ABI723_13200 [Bacteroidia bacterium]
MDDFNKKLENMKLPDTSGVQQPSQLKATLLNSKQTSAIGVWLIAVPCFFLFCVVMKYFFCINLHFFDIIEDAMASMDKNSSTKFISPVLLVGAPLIAIVLNSLAIMHFSIDKAMHELNITIKLKWFNILLIKISLGIVLIFLLYSIKENFVAR